ncbi:hypothetical protein [Streptomyces luteireticuli]|uniref:Spore-associated protein A n=1 Tax=Streptomyces luteireticuli TaxID=173858 RepID=A0ABN0YDM3_9ACTN
MSKKSFRVAAVAAALTVFGLAAPQTALAGTSNPAPKPASVSAGDIHFSAKATAKTKSLVKANLKAAAAGANVCGAGYNVSVYAERMPNPNQRYATLYLWTNGQSTGPSYDDKPICAVLANETGAKQSMGIRLKSNYTDDAAREDFGTFGTYAGPVYQNRGYCGTVYSYMKMGGRVVIDAVRGVGSCN